MKKVILILPFLLAMTSITAQNSESEISSVKAACLDYINTFYKADTTLAYRSVHKSVRKTGFYFKDDDKIYSEQLEMPFDKLVSLAKRWNASGNQTDENSPKEVVIFEVSDKTASAKVTAVWGIDYLSLMKEDGKWMIVNVLWQSAPKFSISETK
ncbi:nuclear transport factor 2 family protein [uncultured Croceitalea sp.]|uniref:nuclear transport factor 2 family protein n=1 Tax=uncultured Croceitalea sp. TaxID=1798908 RepID=UPI00374F422D